MPEQDPLSDGFYETSEAAVSQSVAGTTAVVVGVAGKKIYVTGVFLTLDAAGTIKFSETAGDLSGTFNMGGASAPPLAFSSSHPIIWTTTAGETLNIITATGKAQGVITYYIA